MAQKYFRPDVEAIERLRINKGWALPTLAERAVVSKRTIDSIMAGNEVVISTLTKLAKALNVPVDSLDVDRAKRAEPPPDGRFFEMTIRLRVPFDQFDETRDLFRIIDGLGRKFGPRGELVVEETMRSSVRVRLALSSFEDARDIVRLFCAFELRDLRIDQVEFDDYEQAADDIAAWIHAGQPWLGMPRLAVREALLEIKEPGDGRNMVEFKANTASLGFAYFAVRFEAAAARWSLLAENTPGPGAVALSLLRQLVKDPAPKKDVGDDA